MESKCPICGAPMENGKCGYCNYEAPIQQAPPTTGNAQNQQGPVIINQVNVQPNNGRTLYRRAVSPKNKGVALVLCILFGYFGAHKFYVGKSGIGVLYVFTIGLWGIGWIWDIVSIARGTFTDSYGLPLK